MTNLPIKANDFYSCAKSRFSLHTEFPVNTDEINDLFCRHMFCITFIYITHLVIEMQTIHQHCLLIYISLINKNQLIDVGLFSCW